MMRTLCVALTIVYLTTATMAVSAPAGETGGDQGGTSLEQPPAVTAQPSGDSAPKPAELRSGLYEADTLSAILSIAENGEIEGYLSTSSPSASQSRCDIVFTGHTDGVNQVAIDSWRPWRSDNGNLHIGGVLTPTASGMTLKLLEGAPYTGCDSLWQTITSDVQLTLKMRTRWSSICRTNDHRVRLVEDPNAGDTSYGSLGPYSLVGCGQRENDFVYVESIMRRNDFRAAGWAHISDINDSLFKGAP
jgi:hypothetical protein